MGGQAKNLKHFFLLVVKLNKRWHNATGTILGGATDSQIWPLTLQNLKSSLEDIFREAEHNSDHK